MSEKFTPGPWKIQRTNQGVFIEGNVEKPIGYLALIRPVHPDGNRVMEDANAALIAAAPDMYEALLIAEHWLNRGTMEGPPINQGDRKIANHIQAALAKARGES